MRQDDQLGNIQSVNRFYTAAEQGTRAYAKGWLMEDIGVERIRRLGACKATRKKAAKKVKRTAKGR